MSRVPSLEAIGLLVGIAASVAYSVAPDLRERAREWLRRREEPVDEWILSLDGKDLATVTDREFVDMFWGGFSVRPFSAEDVFVLTDKELWEQCRFRFRHKASGREVRAFNEGHQPDSERPGDLRVVVRGLS